MRQKKLRVVVVGAALLVIAVGFYLFMLSIAPKSNDPAALLQTVGTVSGVVGGLAIVMIVAGLTGKEA